MKQHEDVRKRARAERIYTWFLRLYPGAHRRTFGQPMRETFQDHYRDAIETEGESEAALRRSDDTHHQEALPATRPIGFILTMLVLSLLTRAGYAEFQSLGLLHRLLTLSDLSSSFMSPAGVSWLLGFLVMLAFVFVSARLNPARPEVNAASR
jgi:hypothetical protein